MKVTPTTVYDMTDSEILDAEYRAFIKVLHPATVQALVRIEVWWSQKLYPSVSGTSAGSKGSPLQRPESELDAEYRHEIGPVLLSLVNGHPDPDVREAADYLKSRLFGALFYMDPTRAERSDGEEATIAIHRVHDGLSQLRKLVYRAPFRDARPPAPTWDGVPIGNTEPLASEVARSTGV
jgi:hypothetical protein